MPMNSFAPAALAHGSSCACARCDSARLMITGEHPAKRTAACADCGQSDPARLALPVNLEYRCKGGCGEDEDEGAVAGVQSAPPAASIIRGCPCPPRCQDCYAGMHFLCVACGGAPERRAGAGKREQ